MRTWGGKRIHIGWDQPPVWRSSCWRVQREKSRDGFPVGVEVHRDFPEALPGRTEAFWRSPMKTDLFPWQMQDMSQKRWWRKKTQSYSQYQATPCEPAVQMLPPRNICVNVRAEPSERLDAARLRRSEKRRSACDVFRGGLTTRETLSEMFTSALYNSGVKCSKGSD